MIGEIPIVKKNSNTPVKTEESAQETATQPETETPEVYSPEEFDVVLVEYDYEPVEEEVTVTEAYIPLDETQTLIAYNKKDKQEAVLQVVSDENGEIEYIAFSDKHHKDIYDVQAGMTAKEAKMLRKELKHMKHKGNHYLYDDQSNIMYLLDVQDSEGNEVISEEIDQYEISAIVWKDKKHHKTN
jgi:hypothetical protein